MLTPSRLPALFLSLGCAVVLSSPARAQADAQNANPVPATVTKARPALSSPQLLFQMLISEIAYARGDINSALFGYSDLSQRSQDARITQRANEIAASSVLLSASDKPEEAEAALKSALARQESSRTIILQQLPTVFARNPDKQQVAAIIERLCAPYLQLAEAQLARAQAQLDIQNLDAAHAAASAAARLKPDSERAAVLLAQSTNPAERQNAMEALGRFGQAHPDALDARLYFARWLSSEKRTQEATKLYRQLHEENPENDALSFVIIGIAAQSGDLPGAEKLLNLLVQRNWGDVERLRLLQGEAQEELGRTAEALQTYDNVRPGPHFVPAQVRKAQLLERQGKAEQGLQSLREAAARNASAASALQIAQAQILRQMKQLRAAHDLLETVLVQEPDNIEALYDDAMLAEQLGQTALMEERLRQVLRLKPEHAHALNALGYSFADRQINLEEADQLLSQAIKLLPGDAAIIDSLGWLRFRQKRTPEAIELLQRAYAIFPDAEVAAHLIEAQWVAGQQAAARAQLNAALKADADNPILKALIKRLGL